MAEISTLNQEIGIISQENDVQKEIKNDENEIDSHTETEMMYLFTTCDHHDNDRDFINNKKQRSETRESDHFILSVMYGCDIDIDRLVRKIKASKIECWNKNIIK